MLSAIDLQIVKDETRWSCEDFWLQDKLSSLEHIWRDIYNSLEHASPFASWEWASEWWKHVGASDRPGVPPNEFLIVIVRDQYGSIAAIAPFHFPVRAGKSLYPRGLRPWGVLGQRYEDMTEEPILLTREGFEEQIYRSIMSHVINVSKARQWDFIQFHIQSKTQNVLRDAIEAAPDISGNGHKQRAIADELPHQWLGQELVKYLSFGAYRLELPNTWDEYKASLGKSSRESLNRKPKLLSRICSNWNVRVYSHPDDIVGATEIMVQLHRQRSTVGDDRLSHIPSKSHRLFLLDAHVKMAKRNMVSIHILEVDGKPIAAQCVYHPGNRLLLYYGGFDLEWQKASPMIILHSEIIRCAIQAGITEIDLHRYGQDWKLRLGAKEYTFFQKLLIIRPSLATFARLALYTMDKASKDSVETF